MIDYNTFKYVQSCVDNEGFQYTFESYSNFEEVEDETFHALRKAYLKAAQDLRVYITVLANAEDENELNED